MDVVATLVAAVVLLRTDIQPLGTEGALVRPEICGVVSPVTARWVGVGVPMGHWENVLTAREHDLCVSDVTWPVQ